MSREASETGTAAEEKPRTHAGAAVKAAGNRQDRAEALFRQGFACSQSVFGAMADRYGLEEDFALRLSCAGAEGATQSGLDICLDEESLCYPGEFRPEFHDYVELSRS